MAKNKAELYIKGFEYIIYTFLFRGYQFILGGYQSDGVSNSRSICGGPIQDRWCDRNRRSRGYGVHYDQENTLLLKEPINQKTTIYCRGKVDNFPW